MITTAILDLIYAVLSLILWPVRQLPDVSLPPSIAEAISTAGAYIGGLDLILPVNTILAVLGLFLAIEGGILAYRIVNWLIRKIPTIS